MRCRRELSARKAVHEFSRGPDVGALCRREARSRRKTAACGPEYAMATHSVPPRIRHGLTRPGTSGRRRSGDSSFAVLEFASARTRRQVSRARAPTGRLRTEPRASADRPAVLSDSAPKPLDVHKDWRPATHPAARALRIQRRNNPTAVHPRGAGDAPSERTRAHQRGKRQGILIGSDHVRSVVRVARLYHSQRPGINVTGSDVSVATACPKPCTNAHQRAARVEKERCFRRWQHETAVQPTRAVPCVVS